MKNRGYRRRVWVDGSNTARRTATTKPHPILSEKDFTIMPDVNSDKPLTKTEKLMRGDLAPSASGRTGEPLTLYEV